MMLHVESIYGFYHGQDPRTFTPDEESCTAEEIANHKKAVAALERGETLADDASGCHHVGNMIVCFSTMGIGTYEVVMTDDGKYIRVATYEDIQREGPWDETDQEQSDVG